MGRKGIATSDDALRHGPQPHVFARTTAPRQTTPGVSSTVVAYGDGVPFADIPNGGPVALNLPFSSQ